MSSEEIFTFALGLEAPWSIKEILFDKSNSRLDIYLVFAKGHRFPTGDGHSSTAHDTVERHCQHLNFFQHNCYLRAKVLRVKQSNGRVKTQAVPWARPNSGFTLLFVAFSLLLIENEMPANKAAEIVGVNPHRLWTVFNYWISKAHAQDVLEDPEKVGFDETSTKKGHSYLTSMVDLQEPRVLFATQGKGADCIEKSVGYLEQKQVDTQQIKQVCIDMSRAFIAGCIEH